MHNIVVNLSTKLFIMKHVLLVLLITFCGKHCFSQTIDGFPIAELKMEYIEIKTCIRGFNTFHLEVTFSSLINTVASSNKVNQNTLKDKNGNMVVFYTAIEALNFFDKLGYELNQAYFATSDQWANNVHYYILRKKQTE